MSLDEESSYVIEVHTFFERLEDIRSKQITITTYEFNVGKPKYRKKNLTKHLNKPL